MHFLTDVDPNARVKGSRDPLGIQSVWSRFARLVVGGITSQTTSLDDFRILVVGAWLLDQVDESVPNAAAFVCWEQLASYARLGIAQQDGFRGVTRVRERYTKRLKDKELLSISPSRADQTLTNQSGYGIWGLYRSTAWATGLLAQQRPFVRRPEVDQLIRNVYAPRLEAGWGKGLRPLLSGISKGIDLRPWLELDRKRLAAIADAVTAPLTGEERSVYRDFLLRGGPDQLGSVSLEVRRRQRSLYPLLQAQARAQGSSRVDVRAIAARADEELADALLDILAAGALLDAASRCFVYLTQQGETTVHREVANLEQHFAKIPHLLRPGELKRLQRIAVTSPRLLEAPRERTSGAGRWVHVGQALHDKDFDRLLRLLIEQNEAVSTSKGSGAGWVGVNASGSIRTTVTADGAALPEGRSADEFSLVPYYVPNLLMLADEVGG